jgi:hyperosmotically inducible periplasmic protein
MKTLNICSAFMAVAALGMLAGCANTTKSPDVAANIRRGLDQAGLKSVSVSQDREKGVVTLGGQVGSDANKQQADSIADSMAAGQVVADQIAVVPSGPAGNGMETINRDVDKGISANLDAALIQNQLHGFVNYSVKNHVVTLTGKVNSEAMRQQAQQVAAAVPNVTQVVNELQVKNQKATSSSE